jgi:hypothetical protein
MTESQPSGQSVPSSLLSERVPNEKCPVKPMLEAERNVNLTYIYARISQTPGILYHSAILAVGSNKTL